MNNAFTHAMPANPFPMAAFTLLLVGLGPTALGQQTTPAPSGRYDTVVFHDVLVPMRDGVTLACNIYRPASNGQIVEGKFPVVLERTPYSKDADDWWVPVFVPRGYVVVRQDVRGRFRSEGTWRFFRDDGNDGYDTARWIGEQPWSNGAIGTVGASYPGGTQHAMALANAPYLKAMIPAYATSEPGHFGLRHNGVFEMRWMNWILNLFGPEGSRAARDPTTQAALEKLGEQIREYVSRTPLRRNTSPLHLNPEYEDWLVQAMSHGDYDEFWTNNGIDVVHHTAEYKDVPVYHVSGWFDSNVGVTSLNFVALSRTKKSMQRMIVGPWWHGGARRSSAGEAEFGPDAAIDFDAFQLRWFDHWLKGIDNGVDRESPVRIFVMGGGDGHKTTDGKIFVGGHWRDEQEWPLARAVPTAYYLHAGGHLSEEKPTNEPADQYQFNPRHPVPTIGGNIAAHYGPRHNTIERPGDSGNLMEQGPYDQRCRNELWYCDDTRPLAARDDILVFETEALERDVEVTGPLAVKLWISSDALDTDFTAKLVDVYPPTKDFPAGFAFNVQDGILRARYRNSLAHAELLKPGEIYPLTIEMYPTSIVFQKRHRIRVDISSSNFPRFDVNPNTGEPLNEHRRFAIAVNAIYHDAQHPSQIVLPVVPI